MTSGQAPCGRWSGQTVTWFSDSLERSNAACLYCGRLLRAAGAPASNEEHLIARNFAPKGLLDRQFNFIFRACVECNQRKSVAERHVSSVTLFNSPARARDDRANSEAWRKASNDYHPRKKGVLVKDSHEEIKLSGSFGAASITVGMIAPPQPDKDAVGEVAFSHIQGLFSLVTTEDYLVESKMRLLPQEHFIWYDWYSHEDWGNPQAVELAKRVQSWECAANIESAQGYFKAILRCDVGGDWFWALEWNKHLRLVGGISDKRMKLFENLPSEGWKPTPTGRMRENVALKPEDDILFAGEVAE